jgi:hypothetical protein
VRRDLERAARAQMTPTPTRIMVAPPVAPLVPEPVPVVDAPPLAPVAPAGPDLFHFTSSANLPRIIEAGELRPMNTKYLWATTSPDGDRASHGYHHETAKAYRAGALARIRFAMPVDGFRPWREVVDPADVARLERLASYVGQDARCWYAKIGTLSLDECYGAHGRGYDSRRWIELGATDTSAANVEYVYVADAEHPGVYCAVIIGDRVYYTNIDDNGGGSEYVVGAMSAADFLADLHKRER